MHILRANTSVKVVIGPLVDASDGVTPETGVGLSSADKAEVIKHNDGSFTDISGRTFSHLGDGVYNLTLATDDVNTPGMLTLALVDTDVMRPYRGEFMVVPEQVYDSLYAGNDTLQTDVGQISGDGTAADKLEAAAETMVTGEVGTGSTASVVTTNLTENTDDHYKGRTIVFRNGALKGQAAEITAYTGTSNELEVSTLTEAPSDGDDFVIV